MTDSTDVATPESKAITPIASGRPSRNRERISYSDFYKIGAMQALGTGRTTPVKTESPKEKRNKTNIIKFKVRNVATPQVPAQNIIPENTVKNDPGVLNHSSEKKLELARTQGENDAKKAAAAEFPVSNDESVLVSESDLPSRDRVGTSPLSSVPSDLGEAPEGLSQNLLLNHVSPVITSIGTAKDQKLEQSSRTKRPVSTYDSNGAPKNPSRSKRIKIRYFFLVRPREFVTNAAIVRLQNSARTLFMI